MKISILLPYKENFTTSGAGAVSLFVSHISNQSKFKKFIKVFGNVSTKDLLDNNFINIDYIKNVFFSSSKSYVENFLSHKWVEDSDIIEIHNRPNYIKYIKKKFNKKIFLYFHNDPLKMDGSSTISDRMNLVHNVNKFLFNSVWSKNRFFKGLDKKLYSLNKFHVCYQSSDKTKIDFNKKEKIISFVGKLNTAKGYDLFGIAVKDILNKYKDWKAVVIGDEAREKIIFEHNRLKLFGFRSNKFILNLLKKVSISVVCSRWDEPFGRASLEASSRGSAVIISNRGGLKETAKSGVVLKKLDKNEIVTEISKLIDNKKRLINLQKNNFKNFYLTHQYVSNLIDKVRSEHVYNFNFIKQNKILKILHVTNFNSRFDGRLHYNTSKRLNNGFIRLGHNVLSISDRDILNSNKKFSDISGAKYLQKTITNNIDNFKPDLIVLGHVDSITIETMNYIKRLNIRVAQWFLDPLGTNTPDNKKNKLRLINKSQFIDASFLTTDPHSLNFNINNSYFIPNPSDPSFEILNNFNYDCSKDLFFAMSHGVHRGSLKKGKVDNREKILTKLVKANPNIIFDVYGMNKIEPIWGDEFIQSLSNCSMGLNLSRGSPVKYYSSDRIAQLMGNGLLTFVNRKTKYDDFFTDKELIFYDNIDDLSYKLNKYKKDVKQRKSIAKNGKIKYMKYLNSDNVCQFIIDKTLEKKSSKKFLWQN